MTPTEAITALEKALEAGPTPGVWMYQGAEPFTTPDDAFAQWGAFRISANSLDINDDDYYRIGSVSNRNGSGQNEANAALIAACSPLAIRTLLDAHAGALRDAERLDWLQRDMLFSEPTGIEWADGAFTFPYLASNTGSFGAGVGHARFKSLREAIDAARAALATNTKGANSALGPLDQLP